jgi:hypothetical protein
MEGNDPVLHREISSYLKTNSQTCVVPKTAYNRIKGQERQSVRGVFSSGWACVVFPKSDAVWRK